MPIATLGITSVTAAVGIAGAIPANLNTSDDVRATGGNAGESITAAVADTPTDAVAIVSVALGVEWRVVGTVARAKSILLELRSSDGLLLYAPFTTPTSGAIAADRVDISAQIPVVMTRTMFDAATLRATIQEGAGKADTATVEIDRLWVDLRYLVEIPTLDPFIFIEDTGIEGTVPWIRYRRNDTGQRWIVRGVCNRNGLCVIGAARQQDYVWSNQPGRPGAVTDLRYVSGRPDEPVTPGFAEDMQQMAQRTPTATVTGCALTIEPYF